MANILLTGGRAPAALELARIFSAAGHLVYLAESQRLCLSEFSNTIQAHFYIPPPRQRYSDFISALEEVISRHQIDLLIPTCEEVFYLSMGLDHLSRHCKVFVEPIERLRLLHNKLEFVQLSQSVGLSVPETLPVETRDDLDRAFQRWPKLVLKPVYSRFATRTLIAPSRARAEIIFTSRRKTAWIAQQFIPGRQICTYSVVHAGHLTAHAAYRADFTAGQGAAVVFQSCKHAPVQRWVQSFVESFDYTGQISFDFIETPDNHLYAIECNPRATSGVHLFRHNPRFPAAVCQPDLPTIYPADCNRSSMLSSAMLVYAMPDSIKKMSFMRWLKTFILSEDVIFQWSDPFPAAAQFYSLISYWNMAKRLGLNAIEASTWDIEWNGEVPAGFEFGVPLQIQTQPRIQR